MKANNYMKTVRNLLVISIVWTSHACLAQYAFTVEGSPERIGSPTPNYGTTFIPSGTIVTARAPAVIYLDSSNRYACAGWMGGSGNVPPSGTTTSIVFTINQNSGLFWIWTRQYMITLLVNTNGLLALNTNATPQWYSNTTAVSVWTNGNITLVSKPNYCHKLFYWNINEQQQDSEGYYWTYPPTVYRTCYKLNMTITNPITISNCFGRLAPRIINVNGFKNYSSTNYFVINVWAIYREEVILQRCTNLVDNVWTNLQNWGGIPTPPMDTRISIETNRLIDIPIREPDNMAFFRCKPI